MAKILLVEDDTNLSEIYQARMEAEGYTVVAASDGESALALAAKEKPDLILSDVMMPKISGFEMLDILRNTEGLKDTKVIMLTALGQAEDRSRAESLGADKYLVKSQVTLEDIVSAAQQLLSQVTGAVSSQPATAPVTTPAAPAPEPAPVVQAVSPEPPKAAPDAPLAATAPAEVTPAPTAASTIPEPTVAPAAPLTSVSDATDADAPADDNTTPTTQTVATDDGLATVATPAPTPEIPSNTEIAPLTESIGAGVAMEPAIPEQAVTPPTPELPTATTSPEAPAPEPTPALAVAPMPVHDPAQTALSEAPVQPAPAVSQPPTSEELPVAPTPAATIPVIEQAEQPAVTPAAEPAPVAAPTPAPVPEAPAPEPTPAPEPAPEAPHPAAIDETVVANAIDKLLAKASSAQNAEADITPGGAGDGQHKKIIAPLEHPPQASLQELLAIEAAKENTAFSIPEPAPVAEPLQPALPADPVAEQATISSDEAAAAELLAQAQASATPATEAPEAPEVAPVPIPVEPEPASPNNPTPVASDAKKGFDPNSIAL